jgi:broad specificity phosphatase PhoE
VRHTEAEGGIFIFRGRTDLDLLPEGVSHAKAIGRKLAKLRIDEIYSSKLKRAVKTAEEIAKSHKMSVTQAAELNEINFGIFDGNLIEEMKNKYPDIYEARGRDMLNYRIPGGGKSYLDVQKRALRFILEKAKINPGKTLMFVTHGSLIRSVLIKVMKNKKVDDPDLKKLIDYGCRVYLTHNQGKLKLNKIEND